MEILKRYLTIALTCISGCCLGAGFTNSCQLSTVTLDPPSPAASEGLAFYIHWVPLCTNFVCLNSPTALGAVTTMQGNVITVDVYGTELPPSLSGYQQVSTLREDWVALGPLAAGSYTLIAHWRTSDDGGNLVDVCPQVQSDFLVAQTSSTKTDVAVEFYHAALDHYFISSDANEIHDLERGVHTGWARTGYSFKVYDATEPVLWPVCRYYGLPTAGIDSHFYSAAWRECSGLLTSTVWTLESSQVFELGLPQVFTGTCRAGTVPVYRLWNQRVDSNHRFTTDRSVRDQMAARGYFVEGWGTDPVAMCAPQ